MADLFTFYYIFLCVHLFLCVGRSIDVAQSNVLLDNVNFNFIVDLTFVLQDFIHIYCNIIKVGRSWCKT